MSFISTQNQPHGKPIYQNFFAKFISGGKIKIDAVVEYTASSILDKLTPEQRARFESTGGLDRVKRVVRDEQEVFGMLRLDVAAMVGELGQSHVSQGSQEKTYETYARIGHIQIMTVDQIMRSL